jgi:hypothetical protein
MTVVDGVKLPRRSRGDRRFRSAGTHVFGEIAGRYRALKRRLSDMLLRGSRDYAMLAALSQEIGRMRHKIRADLQRRREERKRRKGATKDTPTSLPQSGGREP